MSQREPEKTIAYVCPKCRRGVVKTECASVFSSGAYELACTCGGSVLCIENIGTGFEITVPCIYCGKIHEAACPQRAFLDGPTLVFTCPAVGIDCCYIGAEDEVRSALSRLEEIAEKMTAGMAGEEVFLDKTIMEEVLSAIRYIAQDGDVGCTCGSKNWKLKINFNSVDIQCAGCGGVKRIPAAVRQDVENICSADKIVIKGTDKEKKHSV